MSFRKLWYYLAGILGLKKSDILLVSYPRAGTTWLRTILCNYLYLQERGGQRVDLHVMDPTMPTLGSHNLMKKWQFLTLPRFVKTHLPNNILLSRPERVLYLVRDPRDTMVSYYHFRSKAARRSFAGEFSDFLQHEVFGLEAFLEHFVSWRGNVTTYLRYEDMKANTVAAVTEMLDGLDIKYSIEVLLEAIRRSSLDEMKRSQDERGFAFADQYDEGFRPVRVGKTRQWLEYFSSKDLEYYKMLRQKFAFTLYGD